MSVADLEQGLRSLSKKIYSKESIHERRRGFFKRKHELAAA